MKKQLQTLIRKVVLFAAVIVPAITTAQINYTQNFNTGLDTWSDDYFTDTDVVPCGGASAAFVNLYWLNTYAEIVSPSLGVSNGGQITISYQYKILNYDADVPTEPTENSEDWGLIELYYATSPTGPWTMIQNITPANHIESVNCTTKTASFFAPAGSNVYIAFAAGLNNEDSDFFIYFDEFTAVQAAPVTCSGPPAASATAASSTYVCNTQQTTLSLTTAYTNVGISYLWQSSADGINFTDTAGTAATFVTTPGTTKWYRAKISCGGDFVYSTPVQVSSSGISCLCNIDFDPDGDIEPITQVSFAGINNTSPAAVNGTPGVEDFKALAPGLVVQGQTYPITLKGNTAGNYDNYFTVYFDWNHDGDLTDTGESYEIGFITNSTGTDAVVLTGSILVPANAIPGMTYMRVLKLFDEFADSPCSSEAGLGYGQAEDYMVNVQAVQTLDWVNLQHPPTMTLNVGETGVVYAQAYEPGVTEGPGAGTGITAWIGISEENTNPATWTTWIPATFNVQSGNNDEFMATIGAGLEPGTYYYASRFQLNSSNYVYGGLNGIWNAATNISGVLTINCATEAPEVIATDEVFCNHAPVTAFTAEGGGTLVWYAAETGGDLLEGLTELEDGTTYYAAQVVNGCESMARTAVTPVVNVVDAPQNLLIDQSFCNGATISEVQVGAQGDVVWYESATSETPLEDNFVITNMTPYYAAQIINGCESEGRTAVTVEVITVQPPAGNSPQEFTSQIMLSDIAIEADGTLNYYASEEDAIAGENALSPQDLVPAGTTTYYITQTMNNCESTPFEVSVGVTLGSPAFSAEAFSYYPNPVIDVLTLSYTEVISAVEAYNLLGQKVLSLVVGQNQAHINMSSLSAGTYILKVTSGNNCRLLKVLKK